MRQAAKVNGSDTLEVALADLETMREHIARFVAAQQ